MLAGHTKFAPDRLFSAIGSAYKAADVFTINDLNEICAQSATAHIENGGDVFTWRNYLGLKYSDLPGVRKLHDFLVVKTNTGEVVMKVREWCFSGEWKRSPLWIVNDDVSPTLLSIYSKTHAHDIPEGKMTDMMTMYNCFIPLDRRPCYHCLPQLQATAPLQYMQPMPHLLVKQPQQPLLNHTYNREHHC